VGCGSEFYPNSKDATRESSTEEGIMSNLVKSSRNRSISFPAAALGALAVGAFALGALAVGALVIGRLVIGALGIGRARVKSLEIGELKVAKLRVGQLEVSDSLTLPPDAS
jgi:hypothetical protein